MAYECAVVVYDACVLYPFHLRNLLIQPAVDGLVAARWTDAIHDEWIRNLASKSGIPRKRLLITRNLMKAVLPEADVRDYRRHEADLALPDADDRHVLAAAIAAQATVILTWNLKHFPEGQLARHNIAARDPDHFLTDLCRADSAAVAAAVDGARANLARSTPTMEAYLDALAKQGLKTFTPLIRAAMNLPAP